MSYDAAAPVYRRFRRPEPRWTEAIERALGDARTVVNVGAGTGNYESEGREVTAVEPSAGMLAARPRTAAPAVRAEAEALPFGDGAFDAALAVLTLHHWHDSREGLRELRRVARDRVVVVTWQPASVGDFWFVAEYLPAIAEVDLPRFLDPTDIAAELGGETVVEPLPVPHDCADGFLGAYWRRPERYLDPEARAAMSVFADLPAAVVGPALERLAEDLRTGAWHRRHARLLELDELDLGYRLVLAT